MNSGDVIGLSILILLALCLVYGLHRITKPVSYTKEEYEKRLKKSSGIAAGVMNAVMYPLQELWHPKAVEAIHVIKDMRQGYYDSLQESGDGLDNPGLVIPQAESKKGQVRSRPSRISNFLRRVFGVSRVAKIVFLSLCIPISMMAQTASDLRAKYGPPSENYEIKPLISLTVKFGQDGQACEMLITERYDSNSESADRRAVQDATVFDLVEQLAPNAQRGVKVNSTSTIGNCFAFRTELYENVLISRYENSCGSDFRVNKTVQILWRNRQCKTRETVIDTQVTGPPAGTGVTTPTLSNRTMPEIKSPVSTPCGKQGDGDYIEYKRIYRKYEISQSAELLSLPQPELTPEAIDHKTTGKMIIEAILGPCGEISNIVMRGHVPFGLTERAVAATRKIKFKPAMDNGLPVPQRIYLEYEFYHCNKAPICSRVTEVVE